MEIILHVSAPEIQSDLVLDPISGSDRAWWASVSRTEFWLDLASDTVADAYGETDDDDDAIIDRYIGNRGYEPPDEFTMYGGYPT